MGRHHHHLLSIAGVQLPVKSGNPTKLNAVLLSRAK
jgi:hypothetical protein